MHETLRYAVVGVYVLLAFLLFLRWRKQHTAAAAWAAAMFGALGTVVLAGLILPEDMNGVAGAIAARVFLVILLAFPWLMYRFMRSLAGTRAFWDRLADVLTGVAVLATLFLPELPAPDEPRPGWLLVYLAAILVQWTTLSVIVAVRFFRDARHEATTVRRRMHLLGAGTMGLSIAIIVSGFGGEATDDVTQALGLVAGLLFLVGFMPPRVVRVLWREPELQVWREMVVELVTEGSQERIVGYALPQLARVVRGRAALMTGTDGSVLGTYGDVDELRATARRDANVVSIAYAGGTVQVLGSRYAPYLLEEDSPLLRYFATVLHASLERARLEDLARSARTALEMSNRELEAFSYSVSHDLRAPLRAIHGFSAAVLEDEAQRLEPASVDFLGRIATEAKRMDRLVDAMLGLARVTRSPMRRQTVDLSEIAGDVVATLQGGAPDRHVAVEIDACLEAHGDPVLLRLVVQNLLDNAWKFTARTEGARIIFSGTPNGRFGRFAISDNGAGFDMRYADKLFGAFQRLHDAAEFAGTGVGLATVQRIVHRHGGEMWADSAVGEGATFGFTLPMPVASRPHSTVGVAR